jgi:hypothetical protein
MVMFEFLRSVMVWGLGRSGRGFGDLGMHES